MVTFRSRRRVVREGRVAAYTRRGRPIEDTQFIIVINTTKSIFDQAFVTFLNTRLSLLLNKQMKIPRAPFEKPQELIIPWIASYRGLICIHNRMFSMIIILLYNCVEIRYTLVSQMGYCYVSVNITTSGDNFGCLFTIHDLKH